MYKIKFCKIVCYTLFLLFIVSCKSKTVLVKTENDFPMVQLPGVITSNDDAVKYVVKNFWNKFLDRAKNNYLPQKGFILGIDSTKFETAFGEYGAALYYLQPNYYGEACASVRKLFKTADSIAVSSDSTLLFRLMALSEKYFYHPNSPILNEELYLPVLEEILLAKAVGELDKMQYEYQFRIAALNRVGTPASDFEYSRLVSHKGEKAVFRKEMLYGIESDYTLIFFNNPECTSCAEILEELKSSGTVQQLIENGRLKILAMYIDEELNLWRKKRDEYPINWIYAHDDKYVLRDNNLYGLRAIPSLYLLDKDKKVLLKDANINMVLDYLAK